MARRWGLATHQPLWVILCRLPEKGRKDVEEIAEGMKETDREKRGTESEETEEIKAFPHQPLSATKIASLTQLLANIISTSR